MPLSLWVLNHPFTPAGPMSHFSTLSLVWIICNSLVPVISQMSLFLLFWLQLIKPEHFLIWRTVFGIRTTHKLEKPGMLIHERWLIYWFIFYFGSRGGKYLGPLMNFLLVLRQLYLLDCSFPLRHYSNILHCALPLIKEWKEIIIFPDIKLKY